MKEQEARVDCGEHQMLLFVEKDDGTYGTVRTGSYMVANYIDDFGEKQRKLAELCAGKLMGGECSPVGYYMMLKDMTPADVAARMRLSVGAVKRHMMLRHFAAMNIETARRYAELFGVATADLFQVLRAGEGVEVRREPTSNAYVVVTSCAKGGR